MARVFTHWSCPFCGGDLYVETTTIQHPDEDEPYVFWASEDDDVTCNECGFHGVVGIDDEEAVLQYDEMSEVNGIAYERAANGA